MASSSSNRLRDQPLGNRLEQKLLELREELAKGECHLDRLDRQRQQVRDTLLRISGAIQILEELLPGPGGNGTAAETPLNPGVPGPVSIPD